MPDTVCHQPTWVGGCVSEVSEQGGGEEVAIEGEAK